MERISLCGNVILNGQKNAYKGNGLPLQNLSLTFIHLNKSLRSAKNLLSRSPMAYNTTSSLDKLTCTNNVNVGKSQNRFGNVSWSKIDSDYLDVKLKTFKKGDNKEFQLVQILTTGEAECNQFMRLRHQLVIAVEKLASDENLSPEPIPKTSKDMDEQLKLLTF